MQTFILDNGSFTIKAGYSTDSVCSIHPNSLSKPKHEKKAYLGSELKECRNLSGLVQTRPFERGYLSNWGLQKDIWDRVLPLSNLSEVSLLISEPVFNLPNIQQSYEEILFEEYGVASLMKTTGAHFSTALIQKRDCCIVVDSGYSFTHVVPFLGGESVPRGIKRLDVGGKVLTNFLKETVSFRHYNMMEETYLMNIIKEECCYVATDFRAELRKSQKSDSLSLRYMLPDFSVNKTGRVIQENNERFTIPEILFNPSVAGISQAGLAEAIQLSIEAASDDPAVRELFYSNILLIGGNFNFANVKSRLEAEIRRIAPVDAVVRILDIPSLGETSDLGLCAWRGAAKLCNESPDWVKSESKSRQTYLDEGPKSTFFGR